MNNVAWKTPVSVPQKTGAEPDESINKRMRPAFVRRNSHPITLDGMDPCPPDVFHAQPFAIEAQRHKHRTSLSRLPVKVGDKIVLVYPRDIIWIQSKGNWVCLHSETADYDHRMTMAELQMQLDPNFFLRVHRNAIVNMNHVSEFSLPRTGNAFVHLRNGKVLPISRYRRSDLRRYLRSSAQFD